VPETDGVQRYQIECPPTLPAFAGSPVSFVAPTVEPVSVPESAGSACAFANRSFAGAPEVEGAVIVQVWLAGDGSTVPALSRERTWKVCEPTARPL